MPQPQINVTPLIDVLLVLLIVFMVITPLKPTGFKTRVPAESKPPAAAVNPHPDTLVLSIGEDSSLALNLETGLGTVADAGPMVARLSEVFRERIASGQTAGAFADDPERPFSDRIERTVFIKAPKKLPYGSVARVIDSAKLAGAFPISLQIDGLD